MLTLRRVKPRSEKGFEFNDGAPPNQLSLQVDSFGLSGDHCILVERLDPKAPYSDELVEGVDIGLHRPLARVHISRRSDPNGLVLVEDNTNRT